MKIFIQFRLSHFYMGLYPRAAKLSGTLEILAFDKKATRESGMYLLDTS